MHKVQRDYIYNFILMGIRFSIKGQLFSRDDGHISHSVGINHLHLKVGQVNNQAPVHLFHALNQHFVSFFTWEVWKILIYYLCIKKREKSYWACTVYPWCWEKNILRIHEQRMELWPWMRGSPWSTVVHPHPYRSLRSEDSHCMGSVKIQSKNLICRKRLQTSKFRNAYPRSEVIS